MVRSSPRPRQAIATSVRWKLFLLDQIRFHYRGRRIVRLVQLTGAGPSFTTTNFLKGSWIIQRVKVPLVNE